MLPSPWVELGLLRDNPVKCLHHGCDGHRVEAEERSGGERWGWDESWGQVDGGEWLRHKESKLDQRSGEEGALDEERMNRDEREDDWPG